MDIYEKVKKNKKFTLLSVSTDKVTVRCNICGYIDTKSIKQVTDSRCGCVQCYKNRKKEKARLHLAEIVDGYKHYELYEYNGKQNKSKIKCLLCGNIFSAYPTNIKQLNFACQNTNCTQSHAHAMLKYKYTVDDQNDKILSEGNNEYDVISNDGKSLLLKHTCGNVFKTTYASFIYNGVRCNSCKKKNSIDVSFNNLISELNAHFPNRFIIDSKNYVNRKSNVSIYDNELDVEYNVSISYFLRKIYNKLSYCRTHYASNTEEDIKKYFTLNDIIYIPQKTFADLVSENNRHLFFDFYLPKYKTVIEYDGEFHYKNIFGDMVLKAQKKNDKIKNIYCKNNNIKLFRIPYWEKYRLDEILNTIITGLQKGNTFLTIKHKLHISQYSSTTKVDSSESKTEYS